MDNKSRASLIGVCLLCLLLLGTGLPSSGGSRPLSPEPGLRLVILEKSTERNKPEVRKKYNIINSPELDDYARARCAKGLDGKTPEFRVIDVDSPSDSITRETAAIQAMAKAPVKAYPSYVINTGTASDVGLLPDELPEFMIKMQKYGGK